MAKNNGWINNLGSFCKRKDGGYYIQIHKDVSLQEGDFINVVKFEDDLANLVKNGVITQEKADGQMEKAGEFVKFKLHKGPKKQ